MIDLHTLPKLRDSMSYIYVEHAIVERASHGIEFIDSTGKTYLPIASLSILMLGPGTNITHAAIKSLAENGCSVLWVGEDATRFYAQGIGETRKGYRLLRHAELVINPELHKEVVLRMYQYRFEDWLDPALSLEQIRGHEGVRVRNTYQTMSRRYGVRWEGRNYDRGNWATSDPINRALSAGNALLNGLCHAAIVSGGYAPGLGFIHTGKQLSFVYDIADLYKTEFTIPLAFQVVSEGSDKVEARVRQACREKFKEAKLLQRILPDIDKLLQIDTSEDLDPVWDFDADGALPSELWDEPQEMDA